MSFASFFLRLTYSRLSLQSRHVLFEHLQFAAHFGVFKGSLSFLAATVLERGRNYGFRGFLSETVNVLLRALESGLIAGLLLHYVAALLETEAARRILVSFRSSLLIEKIKVVFHSSVDFGFLSSFIFNWLCELLLPLDLRKFVFH